MTTVSPAKKTRTSKKAAQVETQANDALNSQLSSGDLTIAQMMDEAGDMSLDEILAATGGSVEISEPGNPTYDDLDTGVISAADLDGSLPEADLLSSLLDDATAQDLANAIEAPALVAMEPAIVAASTESEVPKSQRPAIFAKTSEKIAHRLGDKAGDFLVLEMADATLSAEELTAKQAEMMKAFDATSQIKVREKMVQLFGYLRNGGKLNEVMRRSFTVLIADGQLTSGDKGNLHLNLLTKPYSPGTARAQSGQIFSLFPALKIVVKSERGVYVANPDSVILQTMKTTLGL